jgi:pyruvate dehydrogenase E1 component beta subunit
MPADAKGLLKAAIRDDDPVIVFEDVKCWAGKENVLTDPDFLVPLGKAAVRKVGADVTLVGISGAMRAVQAAVKILEAEGISVEVIDPRTLKPLDIPTIVDSVGKTGRLVIVENAHRCLGVGAEIAAVVAEEAFESLRKPIVRVATPDTHVAFSKVLEEKLYPTPDRIVAAVKRLF